MLNDEFLSSNDKYLVDECLTFMVASTQTTQTLLYYVFSYSLANPDYLKKMYADIDSLPKIKDSNGKADFTQTLNYDSLD